MSKIKEYFNEHPLVFLLLMSVVVFVGVRTALQTKKRKEGEVEIIREAIKSGEGENGVDIKSLLRGITPTRGYDGRPAARTIHDAHGYLNDNEDAVFTTIRGKNIGQIAAIAAAFQSLYGIDLDHYLHNGNYIGEFLSSAEYQQVVGIVKAALLQSKR